MITVVLAVLVLTTGLLGLTALALGAAAPSPSQDPAAAGGTPTRGADERAADPAAQPVALTGAARRSPVSGPEAYPGVLADVPPADLAAYQRAASIVDGAAGCRLDWVLLAAIARVEAGAGAHAPLDGRDGVTALDDTDGGALDRDPRWDAPVGPFALLPATWTRVAVDADDDGVRDPRDVDDAALAAAVVLCSGHDLTTAPGTDAALLDYHRADGFVPTVRALAARYAEQVPGLAQAPVTVPVAELPALPAVPGLCGCGRRTTDRADRPRGVIAAPAPVRPPAPVAVPAAPSATATSPSPTATPTPSADPTPSTDPTPAPTPTSSPSADPSPTPGACPSPSDAPTGAPSPSPSDGASPTPCPTPSGEPSPSGDPTPSTAGPSGPATVN